MNSSAEDPRQYTINEYHSLQHSIWNMSAVFLLIMIFAVGLKAQSLRLSGGNSGEYWVYVDDELEEENYKEHLEDKLKLTLIYGDIGLRGVFFIADPSLPSPYRLTYIDYTAYYNRDPVNIRYGYYYKTFGRGLVLNQYIDADFKIDNSLFGVQAAIKYFESQLTLLSGHPRNIFFEENTYRIKNDNDTTAQILGIDFETKLIPKVKLGGSYVRVNRETDITPKAFTELYGGNIFFRSGPFDAYLEYAQRLGTRPGLGGRLKGYGILFSTSLAIPGLGISFQAMDYDTIGVGGADFPRLSYTRYRHYRDTNSNNT